MHPTKDMCNLLNQLIALDTTVSLFRNDFCNTESRELTLCWLDAPMEELAKIVVQDKLELY